MRIAVEAGRIDPRRAEKEIEIYSSLALKLVREPASPPLHPRGAITMSLWSLMRAASHGSYLHSHIKDVYPFARVG
jgi:hypothetical protein